MGKRIWKPSIEASSRRSLPSFSLQVGSSTKRQCTTEYEESWPQERKKSDNSSDMHSWQHVATSIACWPLPSRQLLLR
ncbi:hypothetical protein Leryth_005980 [Lithospermum erythrorhizon]|nr:hypothetical protein Leryth_005980 [Lithospermum erythrorhizon]